MKRLFFVSITALIVYLAATTTTFGSETSDGIAATNQKWVAAFDGSDAAAITALYTHDARLLPPNSEFVSGTEAIQALYQGLFDSGTGNVELGAIELYEFGGSAVQIGTYSINDGEGQLMDKGKFMVLWKLEDGKWKPHRDMWNSTLPPAGSE